MKYSTPPPNLRSLEQRIRNLEPHDTGSLRRQTTMAMVAVGQMLREGAVKGGTAMALRYGRADARFTQDLDAARIHPLTDFIDDFEAALGHGWGGFTGRVVDRKPPRPQGIRVDQRPHYEDRRSVSALRARVRALMVRRDGGAAAAPRSANSPQEVRRRPIVADDVQRPSSHVSAGQGVVSGIIRRQPTTVEAPVFVPLQRLNEQVCAGQTPCGAPVRIESAKVCWLRLVGTLSTCGERSVLLDVQLS